MAAVHYGGDTDTIASMTGALAGALHGSGWVPERWITPLENKRAPALRAKKAAAAKAVALVTAVSEAADEQGLALGGFKEAYQEVLMWKCTRGMGRDAALKLADALVLVNWV